MSKLIAETYAYGDSDLSMVEHDETERIRSLLLGRKVERLADDHLRLDNGTVVKVVPNEGCGGCAAGNYWLSELNEAGNVITAVDLVEDSPPCDDEYCAPDHDWCEPDRVYSVFVVVEDRRINLFAVEGNDGNGYYGSGYRLIVRGVEGSQ